MGSRQLATVVFAILSSFIAPTVLAEGTRSVTQTFRSTATLRLQHFARARSVIQRYAIPFDPELLMTRLANRPAAVP
jgi:hypothetical protein